MPNNPSVAHRRRQARLTIEAQERSAYHDKDLDRTGYEARNENKALRIKLDRLQRTVLWLGSIMVFQLGVIGFLLAVIIFTVQL